MKNFISIIFVVFLISCGGGSGGFAPPGSPPAAAAPTGNFAGQVDPVQATD